MAQRRMSELLRVGPGPVGSGRPQVVPRDWAVAHLLLEKLREMNLRYPPPGFDPDAQKARLAAEVKVNSR